MLHRNDGMTVILKRDWPLHFILYDSTARCRLVEENWYASWYDDKDFGYLCTYSHLPTGLRFGIFLLACDESRSLAAYCQNAAEHPRLRKRSRAQEAMRMALKSWEEDMPNEAWAVTALCQAFG